MEWVLVPEDSSSEKFAAETVGNSYVYTPVIAEEYSLGEGVTLPCITVTIVEPEDMPFDQSVEIDGITITVKADKGVFPADASLQVERLRNEEELLTLEKAADQADGLENGEKNSTEEGFYAFDITVLDREGKEIQPDESKGTVTVTFTNPDPEQFDTDELSVYHVDENTGRADNLNAQVKEDGNKVEVQTGSFSPFILRVAASEVILYTGGGTIADSDWQKEDTGKYVATSAPSAFPTPVMADSGTRFEGWYADKSYNKKVSALPVVEPIMPSG